MLYYYQHHLDRSLPVTTLPTPTIAKKRMRSREHPKIGLAECVRLAQTVKQYGGSMGVEDYANALGHKSPTSGKAISKIASPQYFGLLKRETNVLRATELLDRLLTPIDDEELAAAKIQAIGSVGIYDEFLEAIGRTGVKRSDVAGNIAQRKLGIQAGAVGDFLGAFIESMSWAGLGQNNENGTFELWATPREADAPSMDQGLSEESISPSGAAADSGMVEQSIQTKLSRAISPVEPYIHLHFHFDGDWSAYSQDKIESIIRVIKSAAASPY
jgi:hypothetical protein